MDKVDQARQALAEALNSGGMVNHEKNVAAAQDVTAARYALYQSEQRVYPAEYPLPPAGDGKDVFRSADEGGEGVVTRKEMSKWIARNLSSVRNKLQEGASWFNDQFSTEDLRDMNEAEFMEIWAQAAALREMAQVKPGVSETDRSVMPPTTAGTEAAPEKKKTKAPAADFAEIVPEGADFKFSLGHQEMSRVMKELENIFACQPCDWLPVDAMANLLSVELGYEDVAEFEDALGGEFSDFVKGIPNAELSTNERGTPVLKLKNTVQGPPRTMTLQVTDRKFLWHVLMQAEDARITIPELEFEFQPMGERRIDTIYNHIASAVWNLGTYVRSAGLNQDTENKVLDTIHLLNQLLDVEHPFTVIVDDPTSRSLWQPIDGVKIEYDGTQQAQAA
eukprot:TRINITY_DN4461_c0_g1_i1.p2 TRINITY_DN4461_c0_g1~~TRINITY_DN4461_c0_g1_i1.p2  ORF type:complete len:392 (+),score=187.25 TRINITY_DN4461_c0_g1_i1:119-1294(+)